MKILIIRAAFAFIAIITLAELGVFNALAMFILVGEIPGTNYSLPPAFMLLIMVGLMWVVLYRLTAIKMIYRRMIRRLKKQVRAYKKRLPRRRFSQIQTKSHSLGRTDPLA